MRSIEIRLPKNQLRRTIMAEEKKKKKGFLSTIKESMNKSGGCCGAGETCGPACGPAPETSEEKKKTKSK